MSEMGEQGIDRPTRGPSVVALGGGHGTAVTLRARAPTPASSPPWSPSPMTAVRAVA